MADIFYVYVLFDWLGIPRYVGKGKGRRWFAHEYKTDPSNILKNEFIERTWAVLSDLPKIKIAEGLPNEEALQLEELLIRALGKQSNGTGPLVNLTDGGNGFRGFSVRRGRALSEVHRAHLSEAAKRRLQDPTHYAEMCARMRAIQSLAHSLEANAKNAIAHQGKKHSEATRRKQSESMKLAHAEGRFAGLAEKLSKALRGKPRPWLRGKSNAKTSAIMKRLVWITNGEISRRVMPELPIPDGWRRGKRDYRSITHG